VGWASPLVLEGPAFAGDSDRARVGFSAVSREPLIPPCLPPSDGAYPQWLGLFFVVP